MTNRRCQVKLRIEGRVQRVWFRGWTIREAKRLGLDGWVRNLVDGSVEAVLAGPEHLVRDMIELCREGPPYANVTAIEEMSFNDHVDLGFRQV